MLLTLKVNSNIELDPAKIPGFLVQKIEQEMTLPNPAYVNAERLGFYMGNLDKHIYLYRYQGDKIILPRGYGPKLVKLLKEQNIPYILDDRRLTLPEVELSSKIKLRDYQKPAVEKLVRQRQGGVSAPCGSGKTIILLEAMARIRQPSLWICHTWELLEQTKERATEVFNINPGEIGVIADGKIKLGNKLTLALIQTLRDKDLETLAGRFGAVFIDEAHHLAARTFFDTVNAFPAFYRLWASATPTRQDGLTNMIFAAGGPIVYDTGNEDLPTITPTLVVVETDYNGHDENYTRLVTDLISNERRNRLIVSNLAKETQGNYSLVLSDRIAHLHTLEGMIKEKLPSMVLEVLTAKKTAKERVRIMEAAKAQQVDILLATQLTREGLDLPHLNRLFLCTPKRAAGAVQQEVGRIMRPSPDKQDAVVYDFWDSGSPFLKAQFWRRRDVYRKLGMNTEIGIHSNKNQPACSEKGEPYC